MRDATRSRSQSRVLVTVVDIPELVTALRQAHARIRDLPHEDLLAFRYIDDISGLLLKLLEATSVDPRPLMRGITDVCDAVLGELSRCKVQATEAIGAPFDEVLLTEDIRQRILSGLEATLDALARAGWLRPDLVPWTDQDAGEAVVTRALISAFRRAVTQYDATDEASIQRSVRLAAVSLAILFDSSEFIRARAVDRVSLRALQREMVQWVLEGRELAEGTRLLKNANRATKVLCGIARLVN